MEEKALTAKKNGFSIRCRSVSWFLWHPLPSSCTPSVIWRTTGKRFGASCSSLSIGYWIAGIIALPGFKVLKPQEALVLTLFGHYAGTLREPGFYWVCPFCTAVNPAAGTKLSQSGDVDGGAKAVSQSDGMGKKISLKMMTLNNSRQKINDCLGNPVEIGIAVIWRVTDTAMAVFNVTTTREYLSLQCDSALRNVVRIYPYDVAPNVDTTGDGVADEGSLRASSRSWPSASRTRSRKTWPMQALRSWKPASPIWPMRRRSPPQ